MEPEIFKARARALLQWVQGESGRVFYVNGYLGHKLKWSEKTGVLTIIEADNGGAEYPGDEIKITAATVETFEFDAEAYQFHIGMLDDDVFHGQGYDIEAYDLQRIEWEDESDEG